MAIPTAEEYLDRANKLAKSFQVRDLSSSEICLLAALQLFPDQSKCELAIFGINSVGECLINYSFGLSDIRKAHWDNSLINLNSPIAESIRNSSVVFISKKEEFSTRYPDHSVSRDLKNFTTIVSVPIHKLGGSVGAMVLFGFDSPDDRDCNSFLEVIASLVSLKLENATKPSEDRSINKEPVTGQALTNREHIIQHLMADGKTNREIAEELGYSESTIRQDAVSLFEKLGVKDRKSAGDLFEDY
ncbi:MAG: DNA-binding response regulator [Microbacteriaceae bacterium]|nr:DNA-binding response regulator [Microbacteriaceae bacterium]